MPKHKKKKRVVQRITLADAIRDVTRPNRSRGRIATKRKEIEAAVGDKDLHLLVEMMCDATIASMYIWQVISRLGIKVSYQHTHARIRPEYQREFGWYYEMVNEDDSEDLRIPRPMMDTMTDMGIHALDSIPPVR